MTASPRRLPRALRREPPRNPMYLYYLTLGDVGAVWAMYACSRAERVFKRFLTADECRRLRDHYHAHADVPRRP